MRALVLIAAALAIGGPLTMGCNVEVGIDRTTWACVEDRDCGRGARCIHGVCVPEPSATVCETRTRAGVAARFAVTPDRRLVLEVGGREVSYPLPSRVAAIDPDTNNDARPIAGCCENACCAERP